MNLNNIDLQIGLNGVVGRKIPQHTIFIGTRILHDHTNLQKS